MDRGRVVRHAFFRWLLLAGVWWALAEGDTYGLPFGLAVAAGVSLLSVALLPPPAWRFRWRAAPAFLAVFLKEILLGGIDVAGRALRPSMPVRPAFRRFTLNVATPAARVLLAWSAGLLPGTISVELGSDALEVHVLDERMPVERTLRGLEERVDAMFRANPDQLP